MTIIEIHIAKIMTSYCIINSNASTWYFNAADSMTDIPSLKVEQILSLSFCYRTEEGITKYHKIYAVFLVTFEIN